jgi:hypothetical protein
VISSRNISEVNQQKKINSYRVAAINACQQGDGEKQHTSRTCFYLTKYERLDKYNNIYDQFPNQKNCESV